VSLLAGILAMFIPAHCYAPETADERRAVYAIVRDTCDEQGVAEHVCTAAIAKAWRESRGNPCARHTLGRGEDGVGLYGQSPKFWLWTVRALRRGRDPFRDPRLGTLALFREYQYAVRRGARSLRDLQRVHSGHSPRDDRWPERDNRWCWLLAHGPRDDRHVVAWEPTDCMAEVTLEDLGPRLDDERMRALDTPTPTTEN